MSEHLSVVVASRNRRDLLARVLEGLAPQLDEGDEVVVVDDGSAPPYDAAGLGGVRLVRTRGVGPARARNAGVAVSSGDVVCFVDDDVVVDAGWLAAVRAHLAGHPDDVGVTGSTTAPAHNPLYEHAVSDEVGGSFLTCNTAYRRRALVAVGGFDERLRRAHEDRDLAWRVLSAVGPIGVAPSMRVSHPGRPFTVAEAAARAEFLFDDWLLFARYPERRASHRSVRWTPLFNTARTWRTVARERAIWRHPREFVRWARVAGAQGGRCLWLTLTRWRTQRTLETSPQPGLGRDRWRIAYVGPSPHPAAGGAPGVAGHLLRELLARGCTIDCFVAASREDDDPRGLGELAGLTYVITHSPFAYGRWYSNHRATKMISSQLVAAYARRRLRREVAARHERSRYDVLYQFSTLESFGVPRRADLPVVVHPSVHAAGERRWVRAEAPLDLSSDRAWRGALVGVWLGLRVRRQRADARRATGVLALSQHFADDLVADYGVDPRRLRVVPNCVDVAALAVAEAPGTGLVAVGRVVVRKGLEDVAALSHRLGELPTARPISVIGAPSLWSDYRHALTRGDPRVLTVVGSLPRTEVITRVRASLALLQLSRYEPFGLTVAEALAVGVPVIVTPVVGAAEEVAADVKIVVAPGDVDALVAAVAALAVLRDDERALLARRCRHEAERLFAPSVVAERLLVALDELLR